MRRLRRALRSTLCARLRTCELQLVETLQLGEKRFVAMIEAGGARYLIGGGAGQVCLLTRLNQADDQTPDETGGVQAAVVSARPWEQP
jgi:flagellar biogenesis protein FliO